MSSRFSQAAGSVRFVVFRWEHDRDQLIPPFVETLPPRLETAGYKPPKVGKLTGRKPYVRPRRPVKGGGLVGHPRRPPYQACDCFPWIIQCTGLDKPLEDVRLWELLGLALPEPHKPAARIVDLPV